MSPLDPSLSLLLSYLFTTNISLTRHGGRACGRAGCPVTPRLGLVVWPELKAPGAADLCDRMGAHDQLRHDQLIHGELHS